nr:MAG TPA: hypothetical protein [Caudoviricetes sp.]
MFASHGTDALSPPYYRQIYHQLKEIRLWQ